MVNAPQILAITAEVSFALLSALIKVGDRNCYG
jgi:hypothetical protein